MASFLRQLVASARIRNEEAGLDLCYVAHNIIVTSGPSSTWPQVAYRTPLKELLAFLDAKHGPDKWAVWEFRAEGTGYPDEEVRGRVWHYPWPDHHPPPFALLPLILASMRNWLKSGDAEGRVAVVHCKAGQGRSGTVSCSYLISEEGWNLEDAMARFTERRMRQGFGEGISIRSQRRWVGYVDRWARHGKFYLERQIEVVEIHCWGLRSGVTVAVSGYVEDGKVIKTVHQFRGEEQLTLRDEAKESNAFANVVFDVLGHKKSVSRRPSATAPGRASTPDGQTKAHEDLNCEREDGNGADVVFKPAPRVILPSNEIKIDCDHRGNSTLGGFSMTTSVAYVWFNAFFEGNGPESNGKPDDSGVFEIGWDAMDGIKGTTRKGARGFDRVAVVWKAAAPEGDEESRPTVVRQPNEGEIVPQAEPADWQGADSSVVSDQLPAGKNQAPIASRESPGPSNGQAKEEEKHGPPEDLA